MGGVLKVAVQLPVARYLARAASHPCLRLFQSQTSTKHKYEQPPGPLLPFPSANYVTP